MKKHFTLIIICVMTFSFFSQPVSAVPVETPAIICKNNECVAGKKVTIDVNIENNPGIMYLELTPMFDSALGKPSIVSGEVFSDFTNELQYIWKADEDIYTNGKLLSITFNIPKSTIPGDYQVGFVFRSAYNYNEESVDFTLYYATIHIKAAVQNEGVIACESQVGKPGEKVFVDVNITANPGIMYLELTPVFDSVLGKPSIVNGEVFPDFTNELQYIWNAKNSINAKGKLATIIFDIPDSAPPGNYNINFIYRSAYNYDEELIKFNIKSAILCIKSDNYVFGDGNNDGKIDAEDIIVLAKALLTHAEYNEVLDCNGDSVVDIRDLVRLKKYLADNTVPLGKHNIPVPVSQTVLEIANLP